jgi:phosphopantothenoylcysteine decarboxylase
VNILVGVTGTVEADKTEILLDLLCEIGSVRLITTKSAKPFVKIDSRNLAKIERYQDTDELGQWRERGDPILHIELARWAEAIIIAPLTAHTLAKIVCGMADNLLTEVVRSWSIEKPILVAPAMSKEMFAHRVTAEHFKKLTEWGIDIVSPSEKRIASEYSGAMAEPIDIVHRFKLASLFTEPAQGWPRYRP